jgi:tetratricopeptide (TPR) repeat protein
VGFNARKSIKLAPGVRMTVTPRGMSVSAGVRGARVTANSRGKVTRTVGIPGSGISHTKIIKPATSRNAGTARTASSPAAVPQPAPALPTPGMLAPKWEKQLVKLGRDDQPSAADLYAAGQLDPKAAPIASLFEAFQVAIPHGNHDRATVLLTYLHGAGYDPTADPFMVKYFPRIIATLSVAPGISASMPVDRDALALLLAELEQERGNLTRAIEIVEGVEPTTIAAVSLAELYAEQSRWDDVIQLTDGLTNDDDASTYLLTQRGIALRERGYFDAAREAFKEALRIRARPAELRQVASIERGKTYLAEGKKAMARKDFERVLAENSEYEGLTELLAATG